MGLKLELEAFRFRDYLKILVLLFFLFIFRGPGLVCFLLLTRGSIIIQATRKAYISNEN